MKYVRVYDTFPDSSCMTSIYLWHQGHSYTCQCTSVRAYGRMEVQLHSFLTCTLHGMSNHLHCIPGQSPRYPLNSTLGGSRVAPQSLQNMHVSRPYRQSHRDSPDVHPIAQPLYRLHCFNFLTFQSTQAVHIFNSPHPVPLGRFVCFPEHFVFKHGICVPTQ